MATKKAKPEPKRKTQDQRLEEFGFDTVIEMITETHSMTAIAQSAGVAVSWLLGWIEKDPDRSARAREARAATALLWDEKAVRTIEEAGDGFEVSKAKELAHHYRWKAAKIAPKHYGDKQEVVHSGQIDIANALAAARARSGSTH